MTSGSRTRTAAGDAARAGRVPRGSGWRGLGGALVLAAAGPLGGCCLLVSPPEAHELLAVGFRTPEQTLRSFQVGWRAEEPDLQRRCFSRRFVEEHRLSKLTWRVFVEELLEEEPFLRIGIADAELAGPIEIEGRRARARAVTHGRTLEFELVLDEFVEAWSGGERLVDTYAPFEAHTTVEERGGEPRRFWGFAELPAGADAAGVSELRVGREWKIDALRVVEEPAPRPGTRD